MSSGHRYTLSLEENRWIRDGMEYGTGQPVGYRVLGTPPDQDIQICKISASWQVRRNGNEWTGNYESPQQALVALQAEFDQWHNSGSTEQPSAAAAECAFNRQRLQQLHDSLRESAAKLGRSVESLDAEKLFHEMVDTLGTFGNTELTLEYRAAGERCFATLERVRSNNETERIDESACAEMHDTLEQFERVTARVDSWLAGLSEDTSNETATSE
jgi:hypothetical protein